MRISTQILALMALPFVTSCGSETLTPNVETELTGIDYFQGAMFGRGPAAHGTPAAESFQELHQSMNAQDRQRLLAAQDEMLVRIDEIDGRFFDRLETAAKTEDRVQLLRLLDESSLVMSLAVSADEPSVDAMQARMIKDISQSGGLASYGRAEVNAMARTAATELQKAIEVRENPDDPIDIVVAQARTYIVPPTCDIIVYLACPIVLHQTWDLPIVANGSVETDLQREQLVDHLVRIAR